jgi:hypothetical protein
MERLAADPYLWFLTLVLIAAAASMIGGALSGIAIAGRELGIHLAALMGAFFGPLAGTSGVAVGLVALALIG